MITKKDSPSSLAKLFVSSFLLLVFAAASAGCKKAPPFTTAPHITSESAGTLLEFPDAKPYPYYLHLPEGYDTHKLSYPLLVHLHGAGELNDGLDPKVHCVGPMQKLYKFETNEIDKTKLKELNLYLKSSFVFIPQCPLSSQWKKDINATIDELVQRYPIDENRIYMTGLSLGGGATWNYAELNPDKYAAIVPVCGYSYALGKEVLSKMPIWAFHAFDDTTVLLEFTTQQILEAIVQDGPLLKTYPHENGDTSKAAVDDMFISFYGGTNRWVKRNEAKSGRVNFTLFARGGHDSWTRAYRDDAMWEWLYLQYK